MEQVLSVSLSIQGSQQTVVDSDDTFTLREQKLRVTWIYLINA